MKKWSLWYWFAGWWIQAGLKIFHGRVRKVHRDKDMLKGPVIFAPNHQNAFMDALVTLVPEHAKKQTGFMVRADIFKSKLAGKVLRSLKMFPAYRMRDGIKNLKKIDETFKEAFFLLENNNGLVIFPEANHDIPRKLRPLRKGVARTAFQFEEEHDWNAKLKIVPVGINYTRPHYPGGDVLVIYGEPINISEFRDLFEEHTAKAYSALVQRLEDAMRPLMIDIRSTEYYDTIEELRVMMSNKKYGRKADVLDRFNFEKEVIDAVDPWMESHRQEADDIAKKVNEYRKGRLSFDIQDWMFNHKSFGTGKMLLQMLFLVLFLPVFLVGAAPHILQVIYPYKAVDKKIKDVGFRSSMKLASSLFLYLVQYVTLLIVMPLVIDPWWVGLASVFGLFFCGLIAIEWLRFYKRLKRQMKYNSLVAKKDKEFERIAELREDVLDRVQAIVKASAS